VRAGPEQLSINRILAPLWFSQWETRTQPTSKARGESEVRWRGGEEARRRGGEEALR
jgi:hypothetical protein